ncbi:MAG: Gfo/Idh/MocA family oxidoreductase, partial [Gammaproteobacteria bacterium]|nr:Gfo/Idh/MocA family oxidoreductase [Gammaproteobacteria bacterium]
MRVAIVGAGLMGSRHAEAFAAVRGVRVSDVHDLDAAAADRLAEQHDATSHADLEGLLGRNPDIVVVATGDRQHRDVASAALGAGCHVLIEKPLAATVEDAEHLVAAAAATGALVAVGHQLRFDPRYAACIEQVRGGALGQLIHAVFRRNSSVAGAFKYGTSTTLATHVLIHDVDLLHAITGQGVTGLWARGSKHSDSPNPLDSLLVLADLGGDAFAAFE